MPYDNNRVLMLGRDQEFVDVISQTLESSGCIVTSTLSNGNAIDMVGSSEYGALLIDDELDRADQQYVAIEARNRDPELPVILVKGPEAVLTQLRQVGMRV